MTHDENSGPRARRPLWNDDAEQAVLGACLMDRDAVPKAREILGAEDFYRTAHGHVFTALCTMYDDGEDLDPLTLASNLEAAGLLAVVGGKEFVAFLIDAVPTAASVVHHARLVRDRADARALIRVCDDAVTAVRDGIAPKVAAQQLGSDALPIAIDRSASDFRAARDVVWETLEAIEAKAKGIGMSSLALGYPDIDEALAGGLEPGELAFFCAAPGGCKTALALNIATNVAQERVGAAVVSAEMGRRANMQRLLSRLSHVPAKKIRRATELDAHDFADLARAGGILAALPLWIEDTPRPTMRQIEAKVRRLRAQHANLRLIVVDFIQLLERDQRASGKGEENRALELTKIAYDLKHLAKELDAAVICTAQVDASSVEKRSDKRPLLSDIRWSQGIREAADFVAMLYRPRAYDPTVYEDTLEVRFDKARDLEPFTATLLWRGATMAVESRSHPQRPTLAAA